MIVIFNIDILIIGEKSDIFQHVRFVSGDYFILPRTLWCTISSTEEWVSGTNAEKSRIQFYEIAV